MGGTHGTTVYHTAIPNFHGTSTAEVTVLYGTIYKRLKVYLVKF